MSGYHNEMCQPCGDCPWCKQRWVWRDEARRLRREARHLRALLARAEGMIQSECNAAGEDEVREHPMLRHHAKLGAQIRAALDKKEAKAKVHP